MKVIPLQFCINGLILTLETLKFKILKLTFNNFTFKWPYMLLLRLNKFLMVGQHLLATWRNK